MCRAYLSGERREERVKMAEWWARELQEEPMTGLEASREIYDQDWFTVSETETLLVSTGVSPVRVCHVDQITLWLNQIVNSAVSEQLQRLKTRAEWVMMRRQMTRAIHYQQVASSWIAQGIPLPQFSRDSFNWAEDIVAEVGADLDSERPDLKASSTAWQNYLVLHCLGLFAAIYDREPRASVDFANIADAHSSINFIAYIIEHVIEMQEGKMFNEKITQLDLTDAVWKLPGISRIKSIVSNCKRIPHEKAAKPAWEVWRDFYTDRITTS